MLQKLENAYLAILRFVVLGVAGLLLVGVAVQVTGASKLLKSAPEPVKAEPAVTPKDVITDLVRKPASAGQDTETAPAGKTETDPYDPYYARIADAIIGYGTKIGQNVVERSKLITVLKDGRIKTHIPEGYDEPFLKGLAATFEKALTDQAVIRSVPESEPFHVIDDIIQGYSARFKKQVNDTAEKNALAMMKYQSDKADGLQSLYYAAGAFGAFLLIVFLSIFIRIERNLRHLERLPAGTRPAERSPQAVMTAEPSAGNTPD